MKKITLLLIALTTILLSNTKNVKAQNQQSIEELTQRIDSLREANSVFRFGLSVGPRIIAFEKESILERRKASISPTDTTLQFESVDSFEVVLAGVVSAYPFIKSERKFLRIPLKGLGFLAKLNLADFGPNSLTVNRVIEGGFGLSYSFSREFSVGFALERVGGSRIRNNFVENEIIYVQGDPLLNLDPTDDNINVEDNYTALSFSWIYGF